MKKLEVDILAFEALLSSSPSSLKFKMLECKRRIPRQIGKQSFLCFLNISIDKIEFASVCLLFLTYNVFVFHGRNSH